MQRGYFRCWRKWVDDNPIWQNEKLWKLFCLCCRLATHQHTEVMIGTTIERLRPGEFITGRFSLHQAYHQNRKGYKKRSPHPDTVWRWLQKLEKMKILHIKTNNKYSIISMLNWKAEQETAQQVHNKRTQRSTIVEAQIEAQGIHMASPASPFQKEENELNSLCKTLVESGVFRDAYAFRARFLKEGTSPTLVYHALDRCYEYMPRDPWAYGTKIIREESSMIGGLGYRRTKSKQEDEPKAEIDEGGLERLAQSLKDEGLDDNEIEKYLHNSIRGRK